MPSKSNAEPPISNLLGPAQLSSAAALGGEGRLGRRHCSTQPTPRRSSNFVHFKTLLEHDKTLSMGAACQRMRRDASRRGPSCYCTFHSDHPTLWHSEWGTHIAGLLTPGPPRASQTAPWMRLAADRAGAMGSLKTVCGLGGKSNGKLENSVRIGPAMLLKINLIVLPGHVQGARPAPHMRSAPHVGTPGVRAGRLGNSIPHGM